MKPQTRRNVRRTLRRGRGPVLYLVFLVGSLAAFLALVTLASRPPEPPDGSGVDIQVTPAR